MTSPLSPSLRTAQILEQIDEKNIYELNLNDMKNMESICAWYPHQTQTPTVSPLCAGPTKKWAVSAAASDAVKHDESKS